VKTYDWKTYTSPSRLRRVWYDRRLRLWTMQNLGADGYQTDAPVDYTPLKDKAMQWLTQTETVAQSNTEAAAADYEAAVRNWHAAKANEQRLERELAKAKAQTQTADCIVHAAARHHHQLTLAAKQANQKTP